MELTLTVSRGFMGFGRKLDVSAKSRKDGTIIEDPYVGNLNKNNPGLDIFRQALEDIDDD